MFSEYIQIFNPVATNNAYTASKDAGFISLKTQHMHWPIKANVAYNHCPPLFFLAFAFFGGGVIVYMKKLSAVI